MSKVKKGSLFGATLLLAGSCIGAGMLALPILTGFAGFYPSLLMFLAVWVFMTAAGLLMVEVHGWFQKDVNISSMVGHALGRWGRIISWVLYLFLFYSLLFAYVAGSGSLLSTFLGISLKIAIPTSLCSLLFVLLFGLFVYLGTRTVDLCNRGLMVGKILCYLGLVFLGVQFVDTAALAKQNMAYAYFSLPVLITSFGFHNMIPSIHSYLGGDLKRVRLAIWGGGLFALLIYLIWEVIALGIIPMEGPSGIMASYQSGKEASQAIAEILGSSWVSWFAQGLAFFAILTSFLAQALGLVHFLADGMGLRKPKVESASVLPDAPTPKAERERPVLCVAALLPPLLLSLYNPQIFFKALNFAGGICAVVLFGVLPVLVVWLGRYHRKAQSAYRMPGGKLALGAMMLFSLLVFGMQLSNMMGMPLFAQP